MANETLLASARRPRVLLAIPVAKCPCHNALSLLSGRPESLLFVDSATVTVIRGFIVFRPPSRLKPAALQLCAVAVCLSVDFFCDAEQPFFAFVGAAGVAVPAFVVGEVVAVRVVRRDF